MVGLLFRAARASTRPELEAALLALALRLQQADMRGVRASIVQWLQPTLQADDDAPTMDMEEGLTMRRRKKDGFRVALTAEFLERLFQPHVDALQEGVQEGLQQGRQQGVQQGERQALQGVLRELLAATEGQAVTEARIAAADSSELRAWIKSLIAARRPGA
jgi:hypothetical protein